MRWGAVIVAAGRGTRFGGPKQLVQLSGRPMLAWSIETFARMPEVEAFTIVTEAEWLNEVRALVKTYGNGREMTVVGGGSTRQASVRHGLDALAPCDAVMIHDGARPLVHPDDVRAGMRAVRSGVAAVLATPVVDTIKVVDSQTMLVERTLDRGSLWAAQTPQFALREEIVRAHDDAQRSEREATDDVALLEAVGVAVVVVPATRENFKVTHPGDVLRAQALLP